MKCILFDLDGTLVNTCGAGNRALEKTFFELYGTPHAMDDIDCAGKTDPAIIREIFRACLDRDCAPEEMERVQKKYLGRLKGECEKTEYVVMKGIPELLGALKKLDVSMGLGTGNLEKGAKIKLARSGLNPFFAFGGFGSDSESRPELLRIAFEKARKHSRKNIRPEHTYVVGDTERDIRAAREAEFKVISVATGHTSARTLKKHKPDFFLEHFEDMGRFMQIILRNKAAS